MPCLAFPPRAHHRCSQYPHEASKQRLYRYADVLCSEAPGSINSPASSSRDWRQSMFQIRRWKPTGKSEWWDFIIPFYSPNAWIGKYFFSPVLMSMYFQLLAMDGIRAYPQLPSRSCLQNAGIPRVCRYGSKQVTPTKYLCKHDHSHATPLTSQPSRRWSLLSIRLGGLQAGETTPAPAESGGCVLKSCWNTGMGATQNTPHLCFCLFQKGKINK